MKTFLFLQGHPSFFWRELAKALMEDGHTVLKINFCAADQLFWRLKGATPYKNKMEHWEQWLKTYLSANNITDIIYFADKFPYHQVARKVAKSRTLRAWSIEFGYFRPDWITLEPEGMGSVSCFPDTHEQIRVLAHQGDLIDFSTRFDHTFVNEALFEVLNSLAITLGRPIFPFYHSDKRYHPFLDYLFWIRELLIGRYHEKNSQQTTQFIQKNKIKYNLVCLQLNTDYQIREESEYHSMHDFLIKVFHSFAEHAPGDRHIVVKIHPLDSGFENSIFRLRDLVKRYDFEDRIHVIKGGNLKNLIKNSKGVVLVNSTVGFRALEIGAPVCALGNSIFNLDGLCHKSGLDTFWRDPQPVDRDFSTIFFQALTTIQVKGSFFNSAGRKHAIGVMVNRLRN
jgi:capsular polysaccharide export protein